MTLECPAARLALDRPNAAAVTFGGATWSYADLSRHAATWERQLARFEAGTRVGLLHANHPNVIAFMIASARLRLVTVLLNTRLATPELDRLHALAGLKAVFSDEENAARWPLAQFHQPAPRQTDTLAPAALDAESTAFVLFTSGTTGVPKGARLSLGNLLASSVASGKNLGAGADQVWLGTLPLFHVGGLAAVWRCLFYGATLSLHARFDAQQTLETLSAHHITHASLVPTTLKRLVDVPRMPALPSLRGILIGGGPCPLSLLERARVLGLPVVSTYGLTEATSQVATQSPLQPPSLSAPALPGISVRVVDECRIPVPDGVEGDIEVRGPTVMQGYLDNASATSETVVDGWLRTRDLGRMDGGLLTVLARRTDLILCGGENIYPAELEAVLLAHPLVEDVAVTSVPDAEWGQKPVAVVVVRGDVDGAALRAYCKERVASYKVPHLFHVVDALPRNALGKVDRKALVTAVTGGS